MGQQRVQRVAEEIKKEIGAILHDEVKDPRIGFITITKVELSRDYRFAKIFYSLLGDKKQLQDTKVGLERSKGFIRQQIGQRMTLRYTPEIAFKLDENVEYSIHILEVLQKIKEKDKSNECQKGN